ncbi:hypothetical protein EIP86_002186 [Pleurotus ostreatoroseus]|nr:hypothetical protein EIP86_002186 [Pleurotus ostreatoroseus]
MYIDLNVPVPTLATPNATQSKKQKGKQPQTQAQPPPAVTFTPAQLAALEARIDLLVHCYTVLALTQTVHTRVDPKTHVNTLDPLLPLLRKRPGLAFVKRLTIVLDEDSEKGFGLTTGNAALFAPYDLLALRPTTAASFALACLTHTQPSPLTAHLIALPLTLPRLPFPLRHTLVGAALKNGAVFELAYAGALGGEEADVGAGGEGGAAARRNWWAAAREVVRVTKGKGIVVSGGVVNPADLRAPRDIGNLLTVLGLAQDRAHDASTKTPQSLLLRAQTRKTYRAVFSEPRIVIPDGYVPPTAEPPNPTPAPDTTPEAQPETSAPTLAGDGATSTPGSKKRGRSEEDGTPEGAAKNAGGGKEGAKPKKKKMKKGGGAA